MVIFTSLFMQDSFYMQVLPIAIVINNSSTLIQKISYKYIASMGHSTEHSPPPPLTHTQKKFEVNPHPPFRCPTVILLLILETNFYTNYSPWHKFS